MINKQNLKTGRRKDNNPKSIPHSKMERLGIPTGLYDKFNNEIISGAKVRIGKDYEGIVLYHRTINSFGVFNGLWYGDKDPYDADCYGKFIKIPKDNGMKMDIEILDQYQR